MATETTKTAKDVAVTRSDETKQIVLPKGLKLTEAADMILRLDKAEDKTVAILHEFDCFPLDGAVAFRAALDEIYGFALDVNTPTWFGPKPPAMIGVPVGPSETKQVPWGRVEVPGVAGFLETSMNVNPTPKFVLRGETKQRHKGEIDAIVAKTRQNIKEKSIYKGKAFRIDLAWMRERPDSFDAMGDSPKFTVPTSAVREADLVFPADVANDIDQGLFAPIEQTQHFRDHRIPVKRGVLLAGDPGVGKTLTAYVTAKKAVDNGWTFIYLASAKDLAAGLRFAAQYAPQVVLFVEDVDRVASGQERTDSIDEVLNALDGVDTKDLEIVTVLTTNHLDQLVQPILRQGRCDTLVQVRRPDAEAAARLVRLYGRGLIEEGADLDKVGRMLAGHLPAEIREAVERAKIAAIIRLKKSGDLAPGGSIAGHVRAEDILAATRAMEAQHNLLQPLKKDTRSVAEKCAAVLGGQIAKAISSGVPVGTAAAVGLLQKLGASAADIVDASSYLDDDEDLGVEAAMGANGDGK